MCVVLPFGLYLNILKTEKILRRFIEKEDLKKQHILETNSIFTQMDNFNLEHPIMQIETRKIEEDRR